MTTILRFLQVLSLGSWVGAILFLAFVVAPGAFSTLPAREQAGAVVGMALARLHLLGYGCAALYFVSTAALMPSRPWPGRPSDLCVVLMVMVTTVSHYGITPRMAALRGEMTAAFGSVDATPQGHALRAAFGRLHGVSTSLELVVLLLGLSSLFLLVKRGS